MKLIRKGFVNKNNHQVSITLPKNKIKFLEENIKLGKKPRFKIDIEEVGWE